jgi:hypothetical protein
MKGKVVFVAALIAFLFAIARPASADFTVVFPDGRLGIELNAGFGLHVAVFWDVPDDFDILTFHANATGGPLTASVGGLPAGIAYWLDFLGSDQFGRFIFDVYVQTSPGGSFFFVTTIAF